MLIIKLIYLSFVLVLATVLVQKPTNMIKSKTLLLKRWAKEQQDAAQKVDECIKKRDYAGAHRNQVKATWIEYCMLDLQDLDLYEQKQNHNK